MKRLCIGVVTGLAVALAAPPARGQISYEFADATGAPQTSFTITGVGGTVPVRVYLRETTAGAPVLSAAGGLLSAAVRLNFGSSGTVATVQTLADVTPGPAWAFGTTNGSNLPLSAVLNNASSFSAGVLPDGDGRILLGTFTLTGQSLGDAPLSALDPNPGTNFDTTQFATGVGIDDLLAPASVTVFVVPVPEPASVLLVCGVAVVAGRHARRRRGRTGGGRV